MADRAELEALSSDELHDKAVSHAVKHFDVGFLWSLVKAIPAAEAAAGHEGEARSDVVSLAALVSDFMGADDETDVSENLRPLYLDYLEKNS